MADLLARLSPCPSLFREINHLSAFIPVMFRVRFLHSVSTHGYSRGQSQPSDVGNCGEVGYSIAAIVLNAKFEEEVDPARVVKIDHKCGDTG